MLPRHHLCRKTIRIGRSGKRWGFGIGGRRRCALTERGHERLADANLHLGLAFHGSRRHVRTRRCYGTQTTRFLPAVAPQTAAERLQTG